MDNNDNSDNRSNKSLKMPCKTAESPVKTTDFDPSLYEKRTLSRRTNVNLYYRILQVHLAQINPLCLLCCCWFTLLSYRINVPNTVVYEIGALLCELCTHTRGVSSGQPSPHIRTAFGVLRQQPHRRSGLATPPSAGAVP